VVWQEFVYTASHDLRSPIANLEGLLLVLKKRLEHKLLREVSQDIAALISESSVQVVLDMHVETIHYPPSTCAASSTTCSPTPSSTAALAREPLIIITTRSQDDGCT
jgi:light-regulated signal transduction histidine kinase (bacteriophytochrome)